MNAVDVREVLADASQGGAYFVDARDADAMGEAAGALDFSVTRIDLAGCASKEEALNRMARALGFPDWMDPNFGALAERLGDLSWRPADGYMLLIEHACAWRQADDDNFALLLDILNETAAVWGESGVPFWALLPLPPEQLHSLQ